MVTDIQYSNSGISYLLSMDSKAMTEGVTCFPNIFFVTAFAFNYINKVYIYMLYMLLAKVNNIFSIVQNTAFSIEKGQNRKI